MDEAREELDVVIVGGGPSGLSAALSLSRARRRVVVVDAGHPRNAVAAHMHGVLGHDGLPPTRLLELGRDEIAGYGARMVRGEVAAVRVGVADGSNQHGTDERGGGIEVDTPEGTLRPRRLLVATGLTDELPDIPGMREQWGRGAVVCPYCDGWEHRNDVVGIVATSPRGVDQAQQLRQWSDRVVYFENGVGEPTPGERDALARRGIRIEAGAISGLRGEPDPAGDRLTGVDLGDRVVPVDVIFTAPTLRPHDDLLRALGAATTDGPLGSWVEIDADGRTSIPGVWAVGNVVDPRSNVSVSMGLGSLVAASINVELTLDDIAHAPRVE